MTLGTRYTQRDHIKGLLIAATIIAALLFFSKSTVLQCLILVPWLFFISKDITVYTIVLENNMLTLTTTVRVIRKVTSYNIDRTRLQVVYQADTTNPETKPDNALLNIFHDNKFLVQIPAKRRFSEADFIRLTSTVAALQTATANPSQGNAVTAL